MTIFPEDRFKQAEHIRELFQEKHGGCWTYVVYKEGFGDVSATYLDNNLIAFKVGGYVF